LILLPVGVDPDEIWSRIRAELWRRDYQFHEISLSNHGEENTPLATLTNLLGIQWASSDNLRTVTDFISNENLPEVIRVADIESLSEEESKDWMMFLSNWGTASQAIADRGSLPTALCVIAQARSVLPFIPNSDLCLGIHYWWGFPSALEVHLLCRLLQEDDHRGTKLIWREYLLPTLVGNDFALIDPLWENIYSHIDTILEILSHFAEVNGWSKQLLQKWGVEDFNSRSHYGQEYYKTGPPKNGRVLWANGGLFWTAEHGLEVHPAILAVLGQKEDLMRRIWRGQAEFLLSLIDQVRLAVCRYLTQLYGNKWPFKWFSPESREEVEEAGSNPLSCQLGYIEFLFKNVEALRAKRNLLSLISHARWVRNELAHYRPVAFKEYDILWNHIRRSSALFDFFPI